MGYAAGNIQIINGQEYTMYTPAWYDAMHAEAQRQAGAEGTAAGTKLKNASTASGVPIAPGTTGGTTSGGGTSSPTAPSTPTQLPPRIDSPSLTGLMSAAEPGGGLKMETSDNGPSSASSGGSGYVHLAPVDTSAAESASFNKAKDQVGQESTGALAGLRSALASRGMMGSGLEERGTAAAATSAAAQLGDVSRQQAVTRADLAQKNAETNLNADVTQRGQDFQKEEAANTLAGEKSIAGYQGQITQRGQDISAINAQRMLELENAQLAAQQRATSLAGLENILNGKTSGPTDGMMY